MSDKLVSRAAGQSSELRTRSRMICLSAASFVASVLLYCAAPRAFADNGGWDYQPYRIQAIVAMDLPGGVDDLLRQELSTYLRQRVDSALAPLWQFDIEVAAGVEQTRVFSMLQTAPDTKNDFQQEGRDKTLLLGIRTTESGYGILAREFDSYLQRWGPTLRRECRQLSNLPEQVFATATQAFAPIAQVDVDAKDPLLAKLKPRGGSLPRSADAPPWTKPGDIFVPMFRRTARNGKLLENGIVPVPWTYIEAVVAENAGVQFQIRSGNRNPLAGRRSGRVEPVAIAMAADPEPTTLVLRSRKNEKKPLAGYEVFQQNSPAVPPLRVGMTDANGRVVIPAGKLPLDMLIIKHGSELVAKVPVVPGAEKEIKIPLPDDEARLVAEARLAAVREDLIDVVARRNILMARARQKIKKKDFKAAEELARALDDLPGASQFNLTLDNSARLIRSDDPQIQKRIDRLIQSTRTLTSKFLDVRPINELRNELRAAQQQPPEAAKKS